MATYYPSTPFPVQFINPDTGALLSGGTLRAFLAGTTTPVGMYTNGSGASAGVAITLNAGGYPTASSSIIVIWLDVDVNYKFVLEDAEGSGKWTVDNILSLTNSFLASNVFGVCRTVAAAKDAAGPLLTNGQHIGSTLIAAAADTGALIRTTVNNTTSNRGGADYEIKSRAQHRTDLADPAWVPDGFCDHYLLGGTTYVIILKETGYGWFLPSCGLNAGEDCTTALQAVLDRSGAIYSYAGAVYEISDSLTVLSGSKVYSPLGNWGIEAGDDLINIYAFDINAVENVEIDGIIVRAKTGEDAIDAAVLIRNGCTNITVKNNLIDNIGSSIGASAERGAGVYVQSSSSSLLNSKIRIHDNTITNIKGWGNIRGDFVYVSYTDDFMIYNNSFDKSNRMGIALTSYASNFSIKNNRIIRPGLCGVDLEPNDSLYTQKDGEIVGNTITDYGSQDLGGIGTQKFAVDFHGAVENIIFERNTCTAGASGIQHVNAMNGARNFKVLNNTFRDAVSGAACKMYSGSGTTKWEISGNTFCSTVTPLTGIFVDAFACDDIKVSNNFIYGNDSSVCNYLVNCSGINVLDNEEVDGFTKLVEVRASSSISGVEVRGNKCSGLKTYGVHLRPSSSAVITGIQIENNTFNGDSGTNVMYFEYLTGGTITQYIYQGNTITGTWTANANSVPVGTTHFDYRVNTAAVGSPFAGQIIYSFAENKTKQYNGTSLAWV